MNRIKLISFGYRHLRREHADVPEAVMTVDLRLLITDPGAGDPEAVKLDGNDLRIETFVMRQPAAARTVTRLIRLAEEEAHPMQSWPLIAVGCSNGRHRSVVIVNRVARGLALLGLRTSVEHMHITRDALSSPSRGVA